LLFRSALTLLIPLIGLSAQAQDCKQPYKNPQPLSEAERALFWGSPEDSVPEKLNATRKDLEDRHYLSGDERYLELFYPQIKEIGGGYMGVGSDQGYLFMGWMKAELAWFTDYDPWISWLHLSYHAFFEVSEDIETFRSWWKPKRYKEGRALLKKRYGAHPKLRKIENVYIRAAIKVNRRLRRLQRRLSAAKIPSFITDEAQYRYVREMVMVGRVRPMLGNLLDKKGLLGASKVAKTLKVPIRVLYPSNAESYWRFSEQFRENIRGLHSDACGWVTRTIAIKPINGDYVYNLQPIENFKLWLAEPWVKRVRQVAPIGHVAEDQYPLTRTLKLPEKKSKK